MSTQKRSLASLKSAFVGDTTQQSNTTRFANNYYPFWQMQANQKAVIRFLPDLNENNPRGFLVEKVTHKLTINGQERKIACLSMYEEECPICKISQAYYKVKDEINGKKYWKSRQHLGQALIIEDPLPADAETGETHQGQVRMIALGYQLFNIIKEAFASDELEGNPYDFEEGYDFIIKKTEQGKYGTYVVGTKFANKQRALTEQELAIAEEHMIDLSTLLPKHPGFDAVQSMLDAEMNGESYDDGSKSNNTNNESDDEEDAVVTPKATTTVKPKVAETTTDDSDEDADADDMLAKIRARRRKAAAE